MSRVRLPPGQGRHEEAEEPPPFARRIAARALMTQAPSLCFRGIGRLDKRYGRILDQGACVNQRSQGLSALIRGELASRSEVSN